MEQAIQDLTWLSKRLKGIIDLGQELQNISSLKQMADEYSNRVIADKQTLNGLALQLEDLKKKQAEIEAQMESDVAKATAETKEILKAARTKADEQLSQADTKAKDMLVTSEKKLEEFQSTIKEKTDVINQLNSDISVLQSKKDNIESQLNALRQRI